jgi:hypothetical protein
LLIEIEIPLGVETGVAETSNGKDTTATAVERAERCIATNNNDEKSYARGEPVLVQL